MKANGKEHSISRGDKPGQGVQQAADRHQGTVMCPCLRAIQGALEPQDKAQSPATVERVVEKQQLAAVVERKGTLHNARAGTSVGV